SLETRRLFNGVSWTGGGDGLNWSDPNNWSSHALPGINDDVTINVPTNPNIAVQGGNIQVHAMNNAESLTLTVGASISVSTVANTSGTIALNEGTLGGGIWNFSGGVLNILQGNNNAINNSKINGDIVCGVQSAHLKVIGDAVWGTLHLAADLTSVG